MRRIIWIACTMLAACSGGNGLGSSSATDVALAMELANAGVRQCVQQQPPHMAACTGKNAGEACLGPGDDGDDMDARVCKALPDGRLVCVEVDDDESGENDDDDGPSPPLQACAGKNAGDACALTIADQSKPGICRAFERDQSSVLACVPALADAKAGPPQEAVDACANLQGGAACSFAFHEHTFQGACVLEPDGKTLVCAPMCKAHG